MRYKVITAMDESALERAVAELLEKQWRLQGGVSVGFYDDCYIFAQAMTTNNMSADSDDQHWPDAAVPDLSPLPPTGTTDHQEAHPTPPQHVINEWRAQCDCCPQCNPCPCDGVAAGGLCDGLECDCFADDDDEQPYGFEPECYMGSDGFCSAAGSEYCDWVCTEQK